MLKFPSPVGELHFSIVKIEDLEVETEISVPCRGTTFLNQTAKQAQKKQYTISVPCRGTTFLNTGNGDFRRGKLYFRPLSGNYISQ